MIETIKFIGVSMSSIPYESDALIQSIRELDHKTMGQLVLEHTKILRRACLGMGFKEEVADDLVQNTWVTFFDVAKRYEGRSKIRTFLFGILYNKAREIRRSEMKHTHDEWNEFESRFDETGHWVKPPAAPDVFVERSQNMALLSSCLDKLPMQQRAAFTLKEVQELSTQEVSEVMGVSANNLGVLSFRAKANLRECLEKEDA
tara:strand:+ start:530 stop:1138 length:609 start_codon:yes stop_codon:yes gene_type:complete